MRDRDRKTLEYIAACIGAAKDLDKEARVQAFDDVFDTHVGHVELSRVHADDLWTMADLSPKTAFLLLDWEILPVLAILETKIAAFDKKFRDGLLRYYWHRIHAMC